MRSKGGLIKRVVVVAILVLGALVPVGSVSAAGDDVRAIAVGDNYWACALKLDGEVWCWGDNEYLQIGDRTEVAQRNRPVRVKRVDGSRLRDITQIDTGGYHTCARRSDRTAWCWGEAGLKLGTGDDETVLGAVQVVGLTNVRQVEAGISHSCALKHSGAVFCWGSGPALGADLPDGSPTPVRVKTADGNLTDITAISAAADETCALRDDGRVFCWGPGGAKLQGKTDLLVAVPMKTGTGSGAAVAIDVGQNHVCMIRADGVPRCWGANEFAEVGDGTTEDRLTPVPIKRGAATLTSAAAISAGYFHSCAAAGASDQVFCWGYNVSGQAGNGTDDSPILSATKMQRSNGDPIAALAVSAGDSSTCVLRTDRAVFCTGDGTDGTIGDGQAENVLVATRVDFPD